MKYLLGLCCATLAFIYFSCTKPNEEPPKFEVSKIQLEIGDSVGSKSDSAFVDTELAWSVSFIPSKPSWIRINTTGITGSGLVYVSPTETNNTGAPRTVTIVLTPSNNSVAPISITVTQPPFTLIPKLDVDSTTLNIIGRPGTIDSFTIYSNIDWTAESSALWLQLSQSSGTGNAKIIVTITEPNYTWEPKTTGIIIKPVGHPSVALKAIHVIQWQTNLAAVNIEKNFGGASSEGFSSIIKTADGGYVMAGFNGDSHGVSFDGKRNGWIVKVSSQGELLWQKTIGGSENDSFASVIQVSDGGFAIAGYTNSRDGNVTGLHGGSDAWVVKLSASGDFQWQKTIGGSKNDFGKSIFQIANGDYLLVGSTKSTDVDIAQHQGDEDVLVTRIDGNGNIVWTKTYGGAGQDYPNVTIRTADNNFLISAYTTSTNGDVGETKFANTAWVLKIDPNGDILWKSALGNFLESEDERLTSIVENNGEYVLFGYRYTQPVIVKFGTQGNFLQTINLQFSLDGAVHAVIKDQLKGNFILVGKRTGNANEGFARIARIDQSGNVLWTELVPDYSYSFDTVVQDGEFFVIAGRTWSSTNGGTDGYFRKLKPGL